MKKLWGVAVLVAAISSLAASPALSQNTAGKFGAKGGLGGSIGLSDSLVGTDKDDKDRYGTPGGGFSLYAAGIYGITNSIDAEAGGGFAYGTQSWDAGAEAKQSANNTVMSLSGTIKQKFVVGPTTPYFGVGLGGYFANFWETFEDAKNKVKWERTTSLSPGIGFHSVFGAELFVSSSLSLYAEFKATQVSYWSQKLTYTKYEAGGKDVLKDLPKDAEEAADPQKNPKNYPVREVSYKIDSKDDPPPQVFPGNTGTIALGIVYRF
ncbi:MAG: outer membrane beta-barrel protein [bacterium]